MAGTNPLLFSLMEKIGPIVLLTAVLSLRVIIGAV
jgi:hypothetical protein